MDTALHKDIAPIYVHGQVLKVKTNWNGNAVLPDFYQTLRYIVPCMKIFPWSQGQIWKETFKSAYEY